MNIKKILIIPVCITLFMTGCGKNKETIFNGNEGGAVTGSHPVIIHHTDEESLTDSLSSGDSELTDSSVQDREGISNAELAIDRELSSMERDFMVRSFGKDVASKNMLSDEHAEIIDQYRLMYPYLSGKYPFLSDYLVYMYGTGANGHPAFIVLPDSSDAYVCFYVYVDKQVGGDGYDIWDNFEETPYYKAIDEGNAAFVEGNAALLTGKLYLTDKEAVRQAAVELSKCGCSDIRQINEVTIVGDDVKFAVIDSKENRFVVMTDAEGNLKRISDPYGYQLYPNT